MNATLTMPGTGDKFRTQTKRRFVLVVQYPLDPLSSPTVVKRSDNLNRLFNERQVRARKGYVRGVLFDTTTGEVIP